MRNSHFNEFYTFNRSKLNAKHNVALFITMYSTKFTDTILKAFVFEKSALINTHEAFSQKHPFSMLIFLYFLNGKYEQKIIFLKLF